MGTAGEIATTDRLVTVTLDPNTITSINPDEVHEWRIAIYDLLENNSFRPARVAAKGPFALHMSIIGNFIVLDVRHPETFQPIAAHYLSLTPFRRLIRGASRAFPQRRPTKNAVMSQTQVQTSTATIQNSPLLTRPMEVR